MGLFSSLGNALLGGVTSFLGGNDLFNGILGGISNRSKIKASKELQELEGKQRLEQIGATGVESRRTAEFQTMLEKFLKDKEKEDRRKGLSNFNRFSSVDYGPPAYVPPAVGNMPTAESYQRGLAGAAQQQTRPPSYLLPTQPVEYDFGANR